MDSELERDRWYLEMVRCEDARRQREEVLGRAVVLIVNTLALQTWYRSLYTSTRLGAIRTIEASLQPNEGDERTASECEPSLIEFRNET